MSKQYLITEKQLEEMKREWKSYIDKISYPEAIEKGAFGILRGIEIFKQKAKEVFSGTAEELIGWLNEPEEDRPDYEWEGIINPTTNSVKSEKEQFAWNAIKVAIYNKKVNIRICVIDEKKN